MKISKGAARRFLLYKQGLLAGPAAWQNELQGAEGTKAALARLEAVQLDPIAVVERNHHLVLRNRVKNYRPEHLDQLFEQKAAFEYLANARCVIPMQDLPDFWPIMLEARQLPAREAITASLKEVVEHLANTKLATPRQIGNDGPRLMGLGYNPPDKDSKASGRAIDLLWLGGEIFVAKREGNEKWYALATEYVPTELPRLAPELPETGGGGELARPWMAPHTTGGWNDFLVEKYLRAYRLADLGDFRFGWQKRTAKERQALAEQRVAAGEWIRVEIEGVRRPYYALAEDAPLLAEAETWEAEPEIRFIAPLDNLLWRRPRLVDLFDFDYTWEVYTPAAKRQYGYYAMPILYGERLVGRLDPKLDRKRKTLIINLLQLEAKVDRRRLKGALNAFARWHGAEAIEGMV